MKNQLSIIIFILIFLGVTHNDSFAQLFADKIDYYVGLRPNTVVSGDFDSDGDIDLAASPNTTQLPDGKGLVSILKNNGDGTFFLADSMLVGDAPNLIMADVDNDSDIDLVVSDWYPPYKIYLILNDGSGYFGLTDSISSYGNQPHLLCAADFDNDDDFDLAVPNSASGSLGIFFNNGDGSFALPPPLFSVGNSPICALPGDLDADGDSDLVISLAGANSIRVLLNDGTGEFPVASNYQTGSVPFAHSLSDYNGDGCLDVAVPNYDSNTLSVMFGNCDGTFGSKVDYPGCHPILAASADFDNDGDIDIAVSNNGCNTVGIYLNNGDGTFPPNPSFDLTAGNGPIGITANDFDNDGDIDLAVCNFDNLINFNTPGYTVSVFINQTIPSVPVELTFFTATNNGSSITLNWATATETNNQLFEIQRRISNNEQTGEWITIGYREGKGTTTEQQNYIYKDDITGINANALEYRLKQIDFNGTYTFSEVVNVHNLAINGFALDQNYPNPFNPSTMIKYSIPSTQYVSLKIHDVLGNEVATLVNEEKPAGSYYVEFNAEKLSSGVYFFQLRVASFGGQGGELVQTKKMILLR